MMGKNIIWLLACAIPFTSAYGRWEAKAVAGVGFSSTPATARKEDSGTPSSEIYKFNYRGAGVTGGASIGWLQECPNYFSGINLGIYGDAYESQNNSSKEDILSHREPNLLTNESLKRRYTIELAGKVGAEVAPHLEVYGRAGILYSSFKQQGSTEPPTPTSSGATTKPAWGTVVGLGIQKRIQHDLLVGVEYNFHYYQKIKRDLRWGNEIDVNYRIRPRYHNVYLTISKLF